MPNAFEERVRRQLPRLTKWWLVSAAIAFASCGDDGPSSPTTTVTRSQLPPVTATADFPAGSTLQIVSGENDAPVGGARVVVGSAELTTDERGNVTLPQDFDSGALVDIEDDAFLTRQTLLRSGAGPRLTLWPKTSPTGLTEDFTSDVVYHRSADIRRAMRRLAPGSTVYVVPSSQIRNDPRAMEAVHDALVTLNDIALGEINFLVDADSASQPVRVDLVIDPEDEVIQGGAVGVARLRTSGWTITGATIVFDSIESARTSTTPHELGHVYGLGHSASRRDIMFALFRARVEEFSPRERLAMRLMLQRPASNVHPDNDRHLRTDQSLTAAGPFVFACY